MSLTLEPLALSHWFKEGQAGATQVTLGDRVSARQCLSSDVGNDAAQARLRSTARSLADGTDLSRLDEHQLVDLLTPLLADDWLHVGSVKPMAYQLVPVSAPVATPAPAAPAPASPRPLAASAPPEPVVSTFGSSLEVAAMVAVLKAAAQSGVPFCEECAKAAAKKQTAESAVA